MVCASYVWMCVLSTIRLYTYSPIEAQLDSNIYLLENAMACGRLVYNIIYTLKDGVPIYSPGRVESLLEGEMMRRVVAISKHLCGPATGKYHICPLI